MELSVKGNRKVKLTMSEIRTLLVGLSNEFPDYIFKTLDISFVNDSVIEGVNQKFLQHIGPTDIITFDYSDDEKIISGEFVIGYEEAQRNAEKFLVSLREELFRLIIHGVLHLVGFDDVTPELKRKMKSVENKLVKKFA